mmetsp:Transcript_4926/g.10591  ORF Transcript_4926/g.10591 Transcript_4926/m.10591 type:complete len:404 (-) Transcript_4926:443-1654(-)
MLQTAAAWQRVMLAQHPITTHTMFPQGSCRACRAPHTVAAGGTSQGRYVGARLPLGQAALTHRHRLTAHALDLAQCHHVTLVANCEASQYAELLGVLLRVQGTQRPQHHARHVLVRQPLRAHHRILTRPLVQHGLQPLEPDRHVGAVHAHHGAEARLDAPRAPHRQRRVEAHHRLCRAAIFTLHCHVPALHIAHSQPRHRERHAVPRARLLHRTVVQLHRAHHCAEPRGAEHQPAARPQAAGLHLAAHHSAHTRDEHHLLHRHPQRQPLRPAHIPALMHCRQQAGPAVPGHAAGSRLNQVGAALPALSRQVEPTHRHKHDVLVRYLGPLESGACGGHHLLEALLLKPHLVHLGHSDQQLLAICIRQQHVLPCGGLGPGPIQVVLKHATAGIHHQQHNIGSCNA